MINKFISYNCMMKLLLHFLYNENIAICIKGDWNWCLHGYLTPSILSLIIECESIRCKQQTCHDNKVLLLIGMFTSLLTVPIVSIFVQLENQNGKINWNGEQICDEMACGVSRSEESYYFNFKFHILNFWMVN